MVIETTSVLTHWDRVTHICVGKLTIIGSDNGLSPGRRQAIIWTNAGILLIGPLGTNFSEILIEIQSFSFKKTHLKMSSGKWRPFCLGLNVLTNGGLVMPYGHLGQHWPSQWLVVWVAWQHQAISETNVNLSSKVIIGIHQRAISQSFINLIHNICSEITLLKLIPYLLGFTELIHKIHEICD